MSQIDQVNQGLVILDDNEAVKAWRKGIGDESDEDAHVEKIAAVETGNVGYHSDVPLEEVVLETAERVTD